MLTRSEKYQPTGYDRATHILYNVYLRDDLLPGCATRQLTPANSYGVVDKQRGDRRGRGAPKLNASVHPDAHTRETKHDITEPAERNQEQRTRGNKNIVGWLEW